MGFNSVERRIVDIYNDLIDAVIDLNDVANYQFEFDRYVDYVSDMNDSGFRVDDMALEKFIKLCLIVYTYSRNSYLIISDSKYDELMRIYMTYGHPLISTTDYDPPNLDVESRWDIIPHVNPDMVGTLNKTYDSAEFCSIIFKHIDKFGDAEVIFAPKYDGVSACINVFDGKITNAVTRKDGQNGQNILPLIQKTKNYAEIKELASNIYTGAIKCEVLCSRKDFENLKGIYKNPRSATSGIVGSPKNMKYGAYLTVMPLVIKDGDQYDFIGTDRCLKQHNTVLTYYHRSTDNREFKSELHGMMIDLMKKYHTSAYPFRTDGIVAYVVPLSDHKSRILKKYISDDAMECSCAFKINEAVGNSVVIDGYMSVGRGGRVTPMIKIEGAIVNETLVTDVSLFTLSKAESLGLRQGDIVEIESSGDVIPILKRVIRQNPLGRPITFDMFCPYCGEKFEYGKKIVRGLTVGSEYCVCPNEQCPRRTVGRLTEFATRLGLEGFSDESFEDIFYHAKITDPLDLMGIAGKGKDEFRRNMSQVSGWDTIKIEAFIDEIEKISVRSITESDFICALNIPGIGPEKAKKIAGSTSIREIVKLIEYGNEYAIRDRMMDANGIGYKTANLVADYIIDNKKYVKKLYKKFNIGEFQHFIGHFACTEFGKREKEEIRIELNKRGYDLAPNLNMECVALIAAYPNSNTDKVQRARKYGIPIIRRSDIDDFISKIKP